MISNYQQQCLTAPIVPSFVMGGVFSALDVVTSGTRITPRGVISYAGFIYTYNAIQCPMEAIHGRKSAIHNVLAGGILGYIGVISGSVGIPFVDPYFFHRHPYIRPQMAGFVVYGGMGGAFALLGGKSF